MCASTCLQILPQINWTYTSDWLADHRLWLAYAAAGLIGLWLVRRALLALRRAVRRSRPPTIHPSLQKYSVDHAELDRQRRELAMRIVATSTGGRLAGFRIVRQVEAVFVEGYRTPEEAVIALKAVAAQRGANALLNVTTDRTPGGRCTASGDAIVAAALQIHSRQATPSPDAAPPADKKA